jgi:hypothetical protein
MNEADFSGCLGSFADANSLTSPGILAVGNAMVLAHRPGLSRHAWGWPCPLASVRR